MSQKIGYMRVSTADQNLEPQKQRLEKIGVEKFFDDVISGRKFDRPGLKALLNYARKGDVIVIVRLDRLGRSLKELIDTVELLKQRGIGLMSLEEKIDTSSAAGELIFHVFGALAHFERRLIAERTKDGIQAAKEAGKILGRPGVTDEKIDAAFALVASGLSVSKAAAQLGIGRSTLYQEIARRGRP